MDAKPELWRGEVGFVIAGIKDITARRSATR
jgi:translation elongation factor EF-4